MGTTEIYCDLNLISSAETLFPDKGMYKSPRGSGSDVFWEGLNPTHDRLVYAKVDMFGDGVWFQLDWG